MAHLFSGYHTYIPERGTLYRWDSSTRCDISEIFVEYAKRFEPMKNPAQCIRQYPVGAILVIAWIKGEHKIRPYVRQICRHYDPQTTFLDITSE